MIVVEVERTCANRAGWPGKNVAMVDVVNVDIVETYRGISFLEAVDQTPACIVHCRIMDRDVAAADKNAVHLRLIDGTIIYRSVDVEILNKQVADFHVIA